MCGDFEVELKVGTRFSVWPLGFQHFQQSTGLEWALDDLTMMLGLRTGTSNRSIANKVSIKAGKGDGYLVITPLNTLEEMLKAAQKLIN